MLSSQRRNRGRKVFFSTLAAVAIFTGVSSLTSAYAASAAETPGSVPFPVFKIEEKKVATGAPATPPVAEKPMPEHSNKDGNKHAPAEAAGASPSAQELPVFKIEENPAEVTTTTTAAPTTTSSTAPPSSTTHDAAKPHSQTEVMSAPTELATTGSSTAALTASGSLLLSLGLACLWLALAPGRSQLQPQFINADVSFPRKGY